MLKVTVKSQRDKLDLVYCFLGSGPSERATFAHIHRKKNINQARPSADLILSKAFSLSSSQKHNS